MGGVEETLGGTEETLEGAEEAIGGAEETPGVAEETLEGAEGTLGRAKETFGRIRGAILYFQLGVHIQLIFREYPSGHKQLRQHLPNPFREFTCKKNRQKTLNCIVLMKIKR